MRKPKIENPCEESWENMRPSSGGRFCEVCAKNVLDLTQKSDAEILKILENSNEKVCGRISKSRNNIASSILIAVSLSAISCSNQNIVNNDSTENIVDKKILITGKIDSVKIGKREATSIKLVTKSKLHEGIIDANHNFQIEVPESAIQENNIIKINFSSFDGNEIKIGSSLHLLNKKNLLLSKTLHADDGMIEIGAVVIQTPVPPDFYFFNGFKISKENFEKTLKENPDFEYVFLEDEAMKNVITDNEFVGTIYLVYSK